MYQLKTDETLTFGTLFELYLNNHAKLHCKRWRDNERAFNSYLKNWAALDSRKIRRMDIQALHAELGVRVGKTTANRVVQLIRAVYNRARFWELLDTPNPASGIKMYRLRSRDRFLDVEELTKWFEAVDSLRYQTTKDFLWMCLLTAARRSNVAAMRWDQINFERAFWRIEETKNGDTHLVPLTAMALEILERRRRYADTDWVFPSKRSRTGHLTKPEKAWREVKRKAGLTDVRIHDLRRTLASYEAMTGANLSIIAKSLCHRDLKSVAVYARLQLDPVREAMEAAQSAMRIRDKSLLIR